MTKVHFPSSTAAFLLGSAATLGLILVVVGCEQAKSPSEPDRVGGRFGDAYQVLTNTHPDAPDEPPAIVSDTLYVQVAYSGGCRDHDFDLDFDTAGDTTRLWLHHNDGGENCESMIHDRLAFKLTDDALASPTILLFNPNVDEPFVVRWNAPFPSPHPL